MGLLMNVSLGYFVLILVGTFPPANSSTSSRAKTLAGPSQTSQTGQVSSHSSFNDTHHNGRQTLSSGPISSATNSARSPPVDIKNHPKAKSVDSASPITAALKGESRPLTRAAQQQGNEYDDPNSTNNDSPRWNNNPNGQTGSSGTRSHFHLQVPPSEQRDQWNCEPYEDMIMEEDNCHIHCMLNGRLGAVFLRDPLRRTLKSCAGPQHVCSLCRLNIVTQHGGNATVMGRCDEDCSCRPMAPMNVSQMIDEVKDCTAAKHNKFIGSRKETSDSVSPDFELFLPSEETRSTQSCEPYESLSLTVPPGEPLIELYQCQSFCAIQGTLGLFHFRSLPRALHPNTNHTCRVTLQTPFSKGIQLTGIFEVLYGYCENGNCLTEAGSHPSPSYDTHHNNQHNYLSKGDNGAAVRTPTLAIPAAQPASATRRAAPNRGG